MSRSGKWYKEGQEEWHLASVFVIGVMNAKSLMAPKRDETSPLRATRSDGCSRLLYS